jgi:hypothetical protein
VNEIERLKHALADLDPDPEETERKERLRTIRELLRKGEPIPVALLRDIKDE